MLKRILIGVAVLILICVAGVAALAWHAPIAEVATPTADQFAPALVARGAVLAAAGNCVSCHTAGGGAPLAGGVPIRSGFGVIYSTNISPDPQTGIGRWSEAAFRRALHEGIARDGSELFPAFPYDHFTQLSDDDVHALYAYLMTQPPQHAPARPDTLPFPLNVRALQAGWKLLFFRPGRFVPSASHDAAWNRGKYLADALAHCGACHTPRNALGAERAGRSFDGAAIQGWTAPPLTAANPSPAPWTTAELRAFLGVGASAEHGIAVGPMAQVVQGGLSRLSDSDIGSLAAYVESIGGGDARAAAAAPAIGRALAVDRSGAEASEDADAQLYTAACASCHYNAASPNALRPDLALNTSLYLADPTNLVRVILFGVGSDEGIPGIVMPGFATGSSDADVARIAAYLRRTRTLLAPWPDLERTVRAIRRQGRGET